MFLNDRGQILFLGLLALLATTMLHADAVDGYIETKMRELHLPGVALAVVHNGNTVKLRGYGLSNLEVKSPVTEETVFEIGSLTKQFTATAILMLSAEGKINLDGSIANYLEGVPQSWSQITVRHLLTHTSGIQNYLGAPGFPDIHKAGLSHDEITKVFFEKLPLEFSPGETWSYSNSGYLLLGNLIEKVSGKNYWDILNERIFGPSGMNSTRSSDPRAVISHRAAGYEWVADHFENRPALAENAYAAGSIVSNIRDMVRWDAALSSQKLLDRKSLETGWTRAVGSDGAILPFNYGFGWFLDTYHGRRMIAHSGGTPGFSSFLYRFPDDHLTVILLTNHSDRVLDHLAIDIASFYVPELGRNQDTENGRGSDMQKVLADLLAGKPEAGRFTRPMQLFVNTVTGKGLWQWLAADGPIRSFEFSEKECAAEFCTVRYKALLGGVTRWFSITTTSKGQIAQIYWW